MGQGSVNNISSRVSYIQCKKWSIFNSPILYERHAQLSQIYITCYISITKAQSHFDP